MPAFGARSESRLATVDPSLVAVLRSAILVFDFTIICGHRDQAAQNEAFATGASKVRWPDSTHNSFPSRAVDVAPWQPGIDWRDSLEFARLAGIIEACAFNLHVRLRFGLDWDGDQRSNDQSFMDIGHIELL